MEGTAPLLQLPHMDADLLRKLFRKRLRTLAEVQQADPTERRDALLWAGLTDEQVRLFAFSKGSDFIEVGRFLAQPLRAYGTWFLIVLRRSCSCRFTHGRHISHSLRQAYRLDNPWIMPCCLQSIGPAVKSCHILSSNPPSWPTVLVLRQVEQIEISLASMPAVSVSASCVVEGETSVEVFEGDVVTCRAHVSLSRPSHQTTGAAGRY